MGKEWDNLTAVKHANRGTLTNMVTASGKPEFQMGAPAFDLSPSSQVAMQDWHLAWLKEAFRVLRTGGVAKVFSATRTGHRLAAAMEDAGFVLDPEHSLEAWAYGCLTEDTEILTADGWVPYHKAKVGTLVLGFDLGTGQFNWQLVEDTFEYPYDREAFRLVGDGTDHIVSVEHRCVVQRGGQWAKVLAGDLEATEVVPCVSWSVPPQDAQAGDMWLALCQQGASAYPSVSTDGPQGRVHHGAPADGQSAGEPGTVCLEPGSQAVRGPRRTSPDLAGVTASIERVHYTGIVWCVRVPTGAFVARRNGMAFVTGNSGFPKSLNVGKALDAYIKVQREQEVLAALQAKGFDQVTWSTDHE